MVAMARTGSGKTAAFLVPLFERLKSHSPQVRERERVREDMMLCLYRYLV